MPPKRKNQAKMPPVGQAIDDGVVSDGDDDPRTVFDQEIALGLVQEDDEEEDLDWNENDDESDNEAQNEGSASSSVDSTSSYVARQRQRAEREILENWACSSIEGAFPSKTWLKGKMDVEKKKFDLRDLNTAILLLFRRLSRLTVGASDDIKEKIREKWKFRNHDKVKRVGDDPITKQQNLLEDLQDLYDDAEKEQAELRRKAEEYEARTEEQAGMSDDEEEDESDASSESSIPVAGSTIQTLRGRYSALEQIYENWGIQTIVGHFTDGLHREDVKDDDKLDAGVIERLRDLSEVTNSAAHGRRIRRRLWRSLRGLEEYDVERVVARVALVGHYYVNIQAEREERRARGEIVGDSSDSEDEEPGEADKEKEKGKGKGKAPATRAEANESANPKSKRRPAQQKVQKRKPAAQSRIDDPDASSESERRRSERISNREAGRKGRPSLVVKLKLRNLRGTPQRNSPSTSQSSVASTAPSSALLVTSTPGDQPSSSAAIARHHHVVDEATAASRRGELADARRTLREAQAMEEFAEAQVVSTRTAHERAVSWRENARTHATRVREELRLIEEVMGGEESQSEDAEDAEPRRDEREDEG
ncbi:hypothetical protein BKA58DRAFT_461278 [Alternaria rosae]|uniref:uncharacterized protein n=1 Tax=Alternaria rosae TaxID=1187941 RepID=UPI001E8D8F7F|nr:uncharacterized protein BKA58DRAFT_461278 [Alternaria rosae]KAH6865450.1 hypothetical protein BKA58DRAFT_461278 [Alternaria rosae]